MKRSCTKTKFATEKDVNYYIQKYNKTAVSPVYLRGYICLDCNCWHLTKRKPKEKKKVLLEIENDKLKLKIEELQSRLKIYKENLSGLQASYNKLKLEANELRYEKSRFNKQD